MFMEFRSDECKTQTVTKGVHDTVKPLDIKKITKSPSPEKKFKNRAKW